jgi:RNA polymerase sigma-70 factor (ECF subfamily)
MQDTANRPVESALPDQSVAEQAVAFLDGLFATALRLTRDRTAAEDLVQDTYLKAVRFADRFERGTNLRAWLYTILHNTFRNELRDAGRDPVEIDSETVTDAADRHRTHESPEELLLRDVLATDLRAALDSLPDAFRQAVWLRDVEDFSYAEIASMLDVPIGTVMSRIARGRRLLLQRLSAPATTAERTGHAPAASRGVRPGK